MRLSKEAFVYNWVVAPSLGVLAKALKTNPITVKVRAHRLRCAWVNLPHKRAGWSVRFRAGRRGPEARRLNRLIKRAERVLGRLA